MATCVEKQWPEELRSCVAEVQSESDLRACGMRAAEEWAGSGSDSERYRKSFGDPGDPKVPVAKLMASQYAFEGYTEWSMAHPDKSCPDRLEDLNQYIKASDTMDPWHHPFRMLCGATLPPGAKGIGILSLGADGVEGTADDIKSWVQ